MNEVTSGDWVAAFKSLLSAEILRELAHPKSMNDRGAALQRERLPMLADLCCQHLPGDLIEIGCLQGGTSVVLAPIAAKHGRKLICVDNWKAGCEYHLDKAEKDFDETIAGFSCVEKVKGDAHSPEIIAIIQSRQYCFAFSDDGHGYDDHMSELRTLLPVTRGAIAVDDIYVSDVWQCAVDVAAEFAGLVELVTSGTYAEHWMRECWLIREGNPVKIERGASEVWPHERGN